jgi:hypothetical protein
MALPVLALDCLGMEIKIRQIDRHLCMFRVFVLAVSFATASIGLFFFIFFAKIPFLFSMQKNLPCLFYGPRRACATFF